ncbi:flavodoxin family protein [Variovorax sp. J2P1-59]|uniref:flavodoxin family protein n=1 Tax=Variovorax flavidus TaxID=3053501 RepID=UPI002576F603|nr:flavodoxin family protein [Variovorax sp. J2P1-59]MDM0078476.1 flavodoxin family protein [Variovorax sp. J2P1-59]
MTPRIRKGQAPERLHRAEFHDRFMQPYQDPAFKAESEALKRIELIAWEAYEEGRKAPVTSKAGPGYVDPDYDLSVDWIDARARIDAAQAQWSEPETRSRVLLVNGSPRNDGTCPGEISKSWRLTELAREVLVAAAIEADVLDLSLVTSEYGKQIHPCKSCVSTAMPLCHWPCSCYPNHSLRQTGDWMNEIYERWVAAHGVILITPTHWYQATSPLKLMIDRLVCADGGNPDPTSTHGKKVDEAKALELDGDGWSFPKHLAGRVYGVLVHGDVAGIESLRRNLCDWLDWMGLVDAGVQARLDRYIGYYEPYATSHDSLDEDADMQEETRNVARAVARAVGDLRAGKLTVPDRALTRPRPK